MINIKEIGKAYQNREIDILTIDGTLFVRDLRTNNAVPLMKSSKLKHYETEGEGNE